MATPAVAVVQHSGFFKSAGHFFASVAHAFVSAAQDMKKGAIAAEKFAPVIAADAAKAEPIVEGVTALLYPPAVIIERSAFHVLGVSLAAVTAAGEATNANGMTLSLDAAAVQAIKDAGIAMASAAQGK